MKDLIKNLVEDRTKTFQVKLYVNVEVLYLSEKEVKIY